MRKIMKYFGLCRSIVIILAVLWSISSINLYAAEKDTMEKSDEIKAFEEFLDGNRKVFFEIGMRDLFQNDDFLTAEMLKQGASLEDILKQVNEYLCWDDKMATLTYAYIDCCKDGKPELAIRFGGLRSVDDDEWVFIIVYDNGRLVLRHGFESYTRGSADLYEYGFISKSGSSSATCSIYEEEFLKADGRICPVYTATSNYLDAASYDLEEEVFEREEVFIVNWSYIIDDQEYEILELLDDADPKKWKKFCALYEQKYGRLYTQEEIDRLIQKRKREAGIQEEWAEKKKSDWKLVENSRYRKYVKEIELAELRKERYARSNFDLKGKWVTCNVENYYEFATVDFDYPGVDYFYQNAIEYSVADYSKRAGISKNVWKLTDIASCGNGLFAVSLKNSQLEQERYLCLLFDNDALKMGIEERTHYIVVADLQKSGNSRMTCDSMLDWESYADSPVSKKEYSYTIYKSKEDFFENTSAGERALNWYLKNTGADKGGIWELDLNAICSAGNEYEYISILRFTCGNEEVVMALDKNNETYAVI